MTTNTAWIVDWLSHILESPPSAQDVQRMTFLLQEKGLPLDLDWELTFYGVYSARLDADIRQLTLDGILERIPSSSRTAVVVREDRRPNIEVSFSDRECKTAHNLMTRYRSTQTRDLQILALVLYIRRYAHADTIDGIKSVLRKTKGDDYVSMYNSCIAWAIREFAFFDAVDT